MPTAEVNSARIARLVAALPELYQPVYGHPEFTQRASRSCEDRLAAVTRCHDALAACHGRPLRVLDLGCAQGYFGFCLAARGAQVHGIDQVDTNIELCRGLAAANPSLRVSFQVGSAEEAIAELEPDAYDLILGLSVFHHVVHAKGQQEVRLLIERAGQFAGALILELALSDEPLYWGPSQPPDPRSLLGQAGFVREVARFPTHLSQIARPLYVVSNRYWILDDEAGPFQSWTDESHALARGVHQGSRRYLFGQDTLLKQYRFDHALGEVNRSEFSRERWFAEHAPKGFVLPKPMFFFEGSAEGWVRMRRWQGKLLLDQLRDQASLDRQAILLAVLDQLAQLEATGLYHSDIRTWNILLGEAGEVYLLDLGAISARPEDCVWPGNPYLSFFIFARELATGVVDDPRPLRMISISPFGLAQPFRAWAEVLWQRPMSEWSFQAMKDAWLQIEKSALQPSSLYPVEAWMKAAEEAMQVQKEFGNYLERQIELQKEHGSYLERHIESRAKQATWRAGRALDEVQAIGVRMKSLEAWTSEADQRANQAALAAVESAALLRVSQIEAQLREQEKLLQLSKLEYEQKLTEFRLREEQFSRQAAEREFERRIQDRMEAQRRETELRCDLSAAGARVRLLELSEAEARRRADAATALRVELAQAQSSTKSREAEVARLTLELDLLGQTLRKSVQHAEDRRLQVESMLASKSWRVTRPLREFGDVCRGMKTATANAAKAPVYWALHAAPSVVGLGVRFVLRRPKLRMRLEQFVSGHPYLREQLKSIALARVDDSPNLPPDKTGRSESDGGSNQVLRGRNAVSDHSGGAAEGASPRVRRFVRDYGLARQTHDRGDS